MVEKTLSLKELLQAAADQLRSEFDEIRRNNPHAAESGAEAEEVVQRFLKDRLPKRFDVASAPASRVAGSTSVRCPPDNPLSGPGATPGGAVWQAPTRYWLQGGRNRLPDSPQGTMDRCEGVRTPSIWEMSGKNASARPSCTYTSFGRPAGRLTIELSAAPAREGVV
jgi:hypothetical protein